MNTSLRQVPLWHVAGLGLAGLAAAMGIGRFAFTPLLPLMQEQFGITLTQGALIASTNYLGYLLGALASLSFRPAAGAAARFGLVAVGVTTVAMALTESMVWWLVLRLIAGMASAFVLIGASAWALAHLIVHKRSELAGWVFAGVGCGIFVAGLVALIATAAGAGPARIWALLGVIAALIALIGWRPLGVAAPISEAPAAGPVRFGRSAWTLVICYGISGFGYIVPATFLPAAARALVNDPAVFGWTWPLFGIAAAISTIAVSAWFNTVAPRRVGAASLAVMALGVLAPALHFSLTTLAISALLVGATFMVMTMAGIQEARKIAQGSATALVSALTAAFAVGQLVGPVLVGSNAAPEQALFFPSLIAGVLLLVSAVVLRLTDPKAVHSP